MLDALMSPAAAKLYEKLVRGTEVRLERETDTDPAMDGSPANELMQVGLLKLLPVNPEKLLPLQPAEALVSVMDHMWKHLRRNQESMASVLSDMEVLQRAHEHKRSEGMPLGELLTDTEEIAVRHTALTDSARFEILAFGTVRETRPGRRPVVIAPRDVERQQSIDARSVYTSECVSAWGAPFFDELLASGERIRLTSELPTKMKIVDRIQALIGLDDTATRCALLTRSPEFVEVLRMSFESAWSGRCPMRLALRMRRC